MGPSQLVPFDDWRAPLFGELDGLKLPLKELRIKNLHKNLCKRTHSGSFHVSPWRPFTAEVSDANDTHLSKKAKILDVAHESSVETAYESCEEQEVVSEAETMTKGELFARVVNATVDETYQDDEGLADSKAMRSCELMSPPGPDLMKLDFPSCQREGVEPEVAKSSTSSPFKFHDIESPISPRQAFWGEAPVGPAAVQPDDEATSGDGTGLHTFPNEDASTSSSSEEGASPKPKKQSNFYTPSAPQARFNLPPTSAPQKEFNLSPHSAPSCLPPDLSKAVIDYFQCSEDSKDTQGGDIGCDETPENLVQSQPVAMNDILPMKWRYGSYTGACAEEVTPMVNNERRSHDKKSKETKSRPFPREVIRKKGNTMRSKLSKQSNDSPEFKKGVHPAGIFTSTLKGKKPECRDLTCGNAPPLERKLDSKRSRDSINPTFVIEMKRSNVIAGFWLTIPADFNTNHMPNEDVLVVLRDSSGGKWDAKYLARRNGLSAGWRQFVLDHGLEVGDVLVFELVKPLYFRVHLAGVSDDRRAAAPPSLKKIPKI